MIVFERSKLICPQSANFRTSGTNSSQFITTRDRSQSCGGIDCPLDEMGQCCSQIPSGTGRFPGNKFPFRETSGTGRFPAVPMACRKGEKGQVLIVQKIGQSSDLTRPQQVSFRSDLSPMGFLVPNGLPVPMGFRKVDKCAGQSNTGAAGIGRNANAVLAKRQMTRIPLDGPALEIARLAGCRCTSSPRKNYWGGHGIVAGDSGAVALSLTRGARCPMGNLKLTERPNSQFAKNR
jgi:hypothetical protein